MRKGDLGATGLGPVLEQLADEACTGCLHVVDPVGEQARVFLRAGRVYAVDVPGRRPDLGARLVDGGVLAPAALEEAVEAQRSELQGWRLGELLVHLGLVDRRVVEDVVREHVRAAMTDLLGWREGAWRFRVGERTRADVAPPSDVPALLAAVQQRRSPGQVDRAVPRAASVPALAAASSAAGELEVDPDAWALLCEVDGRRTLAALASAGDRTLHETAQLLGALVAAGLVEVEDAHGAGNIDEADDPAAPAQRLPEQDLPGRTVAGDHDADQDRDQDEDVDTSISRVSHALAALLGPGGLVEDGFTVAVKPPLQTAAHEPEDPETAARRAELAEREAHRRDLDAAELVQAQAELEAARRDDVGAWQAEHDAEDRVDTTPAAETAAETAAEGASYGQADQPADEDRARAEAYELREAVASAKAELSATASSAPDVHPAPLHEAGPPDEPPVAPAAETSRPAWAPHENDTASLMRELSSLGLEDESAAPAPAPRPQPVVRAPAPKKRKGLFGRG